MDRENLLGIAKAFGRGNGYGLRFGRHGQRDNLHKQQ